MERLTLLAAAGVVLTANAFVLAEVASNRSGAPDARVELTGRHLRLVAAGDENSGVSVRLVWRVPDTAPDYPWLDAAKLAELGYQADPGRTLPPKPVFVALEYDPARPNLVVADASKDPAPLRHRHPDRGRFVIARATLHSYWRGRTGAVPHYGAVLMLETPQIQVPLPCSDTLRQSPESYTLTVTYGRHYEPWISGCRAGN